MCRRTNTHHWTWCHQRHHWLHKNSGIKPNMCRTRFGTFLQLFQTNQTATYYTTRRNYKERIHVVHLSLASVYFTVLLLAIFSLMEFVVWKESLRTRSQSFEHASVYNHSLMRGHAWTRSTSHPKRYDLEINRGLNPSVRILWSKWVTQS